MVRVWAVLAIALSVVRLAAGAPKPRLPENYDRWLNQEVVYIISDQERKEFLSLKSDAERDKYIQEFWDFRNPVRGAKQNPFKEEHYRRLEYANANFGRETGTPGWKTDMGRTWILFGKPASRASFKGYGQIYPLDLWFYDNKTGIPSIPPFFYVLFFVPEDIGDYRFYHPIIDGPMKLVRGSQFNTNADVYRFLKPLGGDVARASLSLIPGEPLDMEEFSPSMASEMLVSKIQNFANDSFNLQRLREARELRQRVKSWFLVQQEQPLEVQTLVFSDLEGQSWLDYAVLIPDEKLGRPDASGERLMVEVGFRLLSESGELIVDDSEERAYPAFDSASGTKKFKPFLVASRIPIVPGKYRLEVQVTNREAVRSYRGERKIEVPQPGRVSLAGPLLADSIAKAAAPDANTPFQYFGVQFHPAAEHQILKRQPLRLLFQLQAPADGGAYEVQYLLAHGQDRTSRQSVSDTVSSTEFRNGRLLKAKTIPLSEFDPGDYLVVVSVRAQGSPEVLASATLPVRLVSENAEPELYFLSNYRTVNTSGVAYYVRALEALAQKDEGQAAVYLRESVERDHTNPFTKRLLVQVYFNTHRFGDIIALYRKLGAGAFESPESLAQIVLSYSQMRDPEAARRVLASAQTLFPKDPLLISLAKRIEGAASGR